ncbi:Nicotinamide-nucleotide amidohydrolase family protein OS=Streptomyces cyaneofuscatus OX=66883 GN=G3I52_14600 PE=4 SV=1 [Streptomyces cyaneofuscatus]
MSSTATDVVRLLTVRGETLAVAESLTGGLVAAEITSVPGASKAFRGSVTAYSTPLKHELLGVDAGLLGHPRSRGSAGRGPDGGRRAQGAGG